MFVSSFIQELRTREKSSISFFVSGVNQANGGGPGEFKISLHNPRGEEIF